MSSPVLKGMLTFFAILAGTGGNVNTSRESGSEGVKRAASSFAAW